MASGINFNPASRQISGGTSPNRAQQPQELSVPDPTDGFQASNFQAKAQPMAASSAGSVDFKVTKEQLTSAAFQQTLATLASSGIQVTITLLNAAEAQPNTTGAGDVSRSEFTQLQNQVNQQGSQLNNLESRFGNLAQSVKPKPAPPTYGGD
ncbi:MAG: hypothetical protein KF760_28575 [Candidatus Eremiobacteraeota bacterium]|nr:hypothetical protein [Candidatus Eremiobacteraeota bacterium]MCW5865851.1 hypothetical protein [Candidatus Eremiobacteraeota bacterium]